MRFKPRCSAVFSNMLVGERLSVVLRKVTQKTQIIVFNSHSMQNWREIIAYAAVSDTSHLAYTHAAAVTSC